MLFHSIDFLFLFAVVTTQYFRAPWLIRWSLAAASIALPIIEYHGSTGSFVAAGSTAVCLGLVIVLRARGQEATARKVLLTTASLLFYSAWRWPYVGLLLFSTVLDYNCARAIYRGGRRPGGGGCFSSSAW